VLTPPFWKRIETDVDLAVSAEMRLARRRSHAVDAVRRDAALREPFHERGLRGKVIEPAVLQQ